MLVVEPGVPFMYRLDGGEVITSDGSEEEKIGPLQAGTGVGSVRLVAFSKTGGESFKAKIQPVNLDGTWVIIPGSLISSSMQCTGGVGEEATDPKDVGMAGATYFAFFGGMGEMTTDSSGQTLDWSLVPSRLPSDISASDFTFEASAITEADGIRLQGQLDLPKASDDSSFLPGSPTGIAALLPDSSKSNKNTPLTNAGLAVVVLLPAVGISLIPMSKKRQRLMVALAIGMMVLSLAGCFGFNLYGTVGGDIKITKVEYAGGSGPSTWTYGSMPTGNPVWVFKEGTASYPVDFFFEVTTTDSDGKETDYLEECSGTVTYSATGSVYEDMTVIIPSSSE
jgi:hypothetical protein